MEFTGHMDYAKLTDAVDALTKRYPELTTGYIGATILDKAIPILYLGNPNASRCIFYVGSIGAGDARTAAVLLRFVNDYFEFLRSGRRMYSVNLPYLHENRRICIIPMLNCDGCTIRENGSGDSILKDRLLAMNGLNPDFGQWDANARGVDLRYNFTPGFGNASCAADTGGPSGYSGTAPESEPETASLCHCIRMVRNPSLLLHLHMDDNSLSCHTATRSTSGNTAPVPRTRTLSRLIARMSGMTPKHRTEWEGTVSDWYTDEWNGPAFSLGCRYPGVGDSSDDYIKIYAFLREVLFSAPLLV